MNGEPWTGVGALQRLGEAMLSRAAIAVYEWHLVEGWSKSTDTHLTLFGYAPDAWEVSYENWASRVHPDDIGEADRRMQALIEGKAKSYRAEYRFRNAEGQWQWVQSWAYVTERDDEGNPVLVTGVLLDAHRAKIRDAQLRHLQKMDLLGQIAGGIAHDFNNLLAILTGGLELLREETVDPELLADMADALQRGEGLTQALLQHVRSEPPTAGRVDLSRQLQRLERVLRAALGDRVELTLEIPTTQLLVYASGTAIDHAILNIAINARDALGAKGGAVTVGVEERYLSDEEARHHGLVGGRYVVVSVTDDGPGMSDEVRSRATEPLFTTKGLGEGTGLGLSTVARLMTEVEGALAIHSTPGEGTAVDLYFPPYDGSDQGPTSAPPAQAASARILVVDDEAAILKSLARQLPHLGYEVKTASNPRQALVELKRRPYDLLLTDIVMPFTIDGIELARRARRMHPELAVLFMSGFASGDQEQAARAAGRLMRKPFTTDELDGLLREVLRGAADDAPGEPEGT